MVTDQDWADDLGHADAEPVDKQPAPVADNDDDSEAEPGRRSAGRLHTRASRALTRRPSQRSTREEQAGQTHFASVDQWVSGWLLPMWTRDLHGDESTWCPQWWRHPEAVARLTALWLSWEHLRLDPATGMSSWWRDHADHHLAVLLSSSTVFKGCSPNGGHTAYPVAQLPSDPTPEGLFDT